MERDIVGIFWISLVRRSFVSAFPSDTELSRTASALSDAHDACFDPMPRSRLDLVRNRFCDSAQEEGFGIDWNVAGGRGNGFGRVQRTDQR